MTEIDAGSNGAVPEKRQTALPREWSATNEFLGIVVLRFLESEGSFSSQELFEMMVGRTGLLIETVLEDHIRRLDEPRDYHFLLVSRTDYGNSRADLHRLKGLFQEIGFFKET